MKTITLLLTLIFTFNFLQPARAELTRDQLINGMTYLAYETTHLRKNAKVCFTKDPSKAHINMHLTDRSLGTDRVICITDRPLGADLTIHFTDSPLGASRTITMVTQEALADVVIFLNPSPIGADYSLCISDSALGANLTICFSNSALGSDETIQMK